MNGINPTIEECDEAQRRVDKVLVKWRAMDISITPKVHIYEDHAVPQMRYHGGIGDKGEDREVSLKETRDAERKAARDDVRREVCSRY